MKKSLSILGLCALLALPVGCAQDNQQSQRNRQENMRTQLNQQTQRNAANKNTTKRNITNRNTTNRRNNVIGGVESSISQKGRIEKVRITADKANVRAGVSNNTPVLQTQNKNATYDVINEVGDWFAVKLPNNQIGFVPQEDCKPIVAEEQTPAAPTPAEQATPQETTQNGQQGGTTPKTPSESTNTSTLSSVEQQMIKLVNEARAQNNLPALKADVPLANVARTKSQDMIDNNYFSHNSPKYGSPFDMMKAFGIKYVQAGENLAGNQDVQSAHNALMNSPGHRQNILNPNFTHIGIGAKTGGPYGTMFTQMFISKPQ